jgi:hypothetical protein
MVGERVIRDGDGDLHVARGALKVLRMRASALAAWATRARASKVARMAAMRVMTSLLPLLWAGGRMPSGIVSHNDDVKRGVIRRL